MFDRTFVGLGREHTEHHHHETKIIEKRAPTDESVKLLAELEKAAADKIINAVRVVDAEIDCVIHTTHNMMDEDMVFTAIFSVGGKKMHIVHKEHVHNQKSGSEIAQIIIDAMSKEIARVMFAGCLNSANNAPFLKALKP